MRLVRATVLIALAFLAATPARAAQPGALIPPADAVVGRSFEQPGSEWGPGHRGIDYQVASGTLIRSAASGVVTFAGQVAGSLAVSIQHDGGLQTTYSELSEVLVAAGQDVTSGTFVGRAGRAHAGEPSGLHFGVKVDGRYVDPQAHIVALDVSDAIALAPLVWRPPEEMPEEFRAAFDDAGVSARGCVEGVSGRALSSAPNDNVAVAIAGLGSKTLGGVGADMYESGPEELGYDPASVYRFSYRGSKGADAHEPYARTDTYGGVRVAAAKLRALLARVADEHPGSDVDLIAHSQGGIVARWFLSHLAEKFDPRLPRIDHVVTFSSPHLGAPLAGQVDDLARGTATGAGVLKVASRWSRSGAILPDPLSASVADLAPGSDVLESLAREDVVFGTRVLALGIANDVVVPADRAHWTGQANRVVGPTGFYGHSAIVRSPEARSIAYDFLRDAPPHCRGTWDLWGPRAGRAVGWVEEGTADVYREAERLLWPGIAALW